MVAGQETVRRWAFVNCWHINQKENPAMWASYTSGPDSVAVVSTPYDLRVNLPEAVLGAGVSYINKNVPRTRFDHASLFFFKDSCFRYEAEYRLFTTPTSGETVLWDDEKDFGRLVSINLGHIHRVVCHPRISPAKCQEVEVLGKAHCQRGGYSNQVLLEFSASNASEPRFVETFVFAICGILKRRRHVMTFVMTLAILR